MVVLRGEILMSKVEIKQDGLRAHVLVDGEKLNHVTKVKFELNPNEVPRFEFEVLGIDADMSFEHAMVSVTHNMVLARELIRAELRKRDSFYNTYVNLLANHIRECDGSMNNLEIAKSFIDDCVIGVGGEEK